MRDRRNRPAPGPEGQRHPRGGPGCGAGRAQADDRRGGPRARPGRAAPGIGTGLVDRVEDDLRPVEELELDRLLEDFSVLMPEDLVDIDITWKLLEWGDRLAALFETIQEGIGGAHGVGDEGIDAAEEFGWMHDLNGLLDEWFGDDPDEEDEGTPDVEGA